jgi:L-aspartate oxidase
MRIKTDFLVIGSGIAGLSYALKVAPYGKVLVVAKGDAMETNTRYAQGGIAAVMYSPDTYEKHITDTINAGAGLCDEKIVRFTITESTERIHELIEWGTQFDKNLQGRYDLSKEGGHSENRVLHSKDQTGREIQNALLAELRKHPNIELLEYRYAIDILTQHHLGQIVNKRTPDVHCYGAYFLHIKTGEIDTVLSRLTLLATGGAGNVYNNTTNPPVATGDGIALAYRAKAKVENMEFMQFHPTALYNPRERPSFLITEAIRGAGGVLRKADGSEFMDKYDNRKSLAPRDIVARAIDTEMKLDGVEHVYLDCRHMDHEILLASFPTIYAKCLSIGIDITRDMIPVVPAAHYTCGGIVTDENGRTSIHQLYASGECACTGMHGANRLASNSLLESVVFSHRAAMDSGKRLDKLKFCEEIPDWNAEGMVLNEEMILITQTRKELRELMSNYVGIVRSDLRLKRAMDRLELLFRETEAIYNKSILTVQICELRNMITIAYLIIKMAMKRKESRGLHFSIDYPETNQTKPEQ